MQNLNLEKQNIFKNFTNIVNNKYKIAQGRDIWANSPWKNMAQLCNNDSGGGGEEFMCYQCNSVGIPCSINGTKLKGKNKGDGVINGRSVEVKTSRQTSSGSAFQHELGENPWDTEFMIFFDVSPTKLYITIIPNFSEEFYKESGRDNTKKCKPYFPTKSITWRKQAGNFKLDTTVQLNENNKYTFIINDSTSYVEFREFINFMIPQIEK
jgi:hypothetical protein